jgi:glycosyltransferase involved in cell wall biosynthesis
MTGDGTLWTSTASLDYQFWTRYLDIFDQVQLLVRARPQAVPPDGWVMATGDRIKALPLPDFTGPTGFVVNYPQIIKLMRRALPEMQAIILRTPCFLGNELWRMLEAGRPYGAEVVTDPYDVFAPGANRHPLRPFFRWWFPQQLRKVCARACSTAYVTAQALQERYPCPNYTTYYSSIVLSERDCIKTPREMRRDAQEWTLIYVGTLAQLYKAPDVLIKAVGQCVSGGLNLRLIIAGEGQYQSELEKMANELGLGERVRFLGQLVTREAVLNQLDQADLFVLPSRQEGLPKALVEAMARALPCIGSNVGGIPELLPVEDRVPAGDVQALAEKIREVITSPERLASMSARNLVKAQEYREEILRQRRLGFYREVREQTQSWLGTGTYSWVTK